LRGDDRKKSGRFSKEGLILQTQNQSPLCLRPAPIRVHNRVSARPAERFFEEFLPPQASPEWMSKTFNKLTMKKRLHEATPVILGAFVLAALLVLAVSAVRAADGPNRPAASQLHPSPTGRPEAVKAPQWEKINKVLSEVSFDNIPLSEVTKFLRDQFKNEFDVLLPASYPTSPIDPATGLPGPMQDVASVGVVLRLNNITVSEVFNAMNLSFEINKLPLLWDLTVNGSRPTAVLRILDLPKPEPPAMPPPQEAQKRAVFYVGDLLGSPEAGGLGFPQIHQTLVEVCLGAFRREPRMAIHEAAQLLVVTGTGDELDLIREILVALKEKVKPAAELKGLSKTPESKGKLAEPKTP
jgi:hypothetical protein